MTGSVREGQCVLTRAHRTIILKMRYNSDKHYTVMGTGVGRLPDATHVITTGGCLPPMQRIGLGYTEGT